MQNKQSYIGFPLLTYAFALILVSCKQRQVSKIEVIKFDRLLIDSLKKTSDTSYTEFIGRSDFYWADYFIHKSDSQIIKLLKDSAGNVVALNKSKAGKTYFAAEYYSNGQLVAKTEFAPGKVDGRATYYYRDGRIKSLGQWLDYKQVGIWRNYSENGELKEIIHFDNDGDTVSFEKIRDL